MRLETAIKDKQGKVLRTAELALVFRDDNVIREVP
jgi:hypothetical protein